MRRNEANLALDFYNSFLKYPTRPALNINNKNYDYNQLNQMASLISNIIDKINSKNKFIALLTNKELESYIGILGILYSGKAYMPLSKKFPIKRLLSMLDASASEIVLVSKESSEILGELLPFMKKKMTFIGFDENIVNHKKRYPKHNFVHIDLRNFLNSKCEIKSIKNDDPAYLLFTSGSTGIPKGVSISHGNVISYLKNIDKKIDFSEKDRFSQTFDLNFDLSVHDMFVCWRNGACLFAPNESDMLLPVEYIKKNKISSWFSVPSLAMIIDNYGRLTDRMFPDIRYSLFCGEALPASLANKWSKAAPNSKLINLYGPTEATIAISMFFYEKGKNEKDFVNGIVPIGQLFEDQSGLIINESKNQVKDNEKGELCISGSQVTKGYLNNLDKTKSQFIKLSNNSNQLWYRTGDCVMRNDYGVYYYLNRLDNQVKINGNRIELGEIEHVIREISKTDMVCVIVLSDTINKLDQIVAFVSGSKVDESKILFHCDTKLPKYMIPNKIKFINNMPLNINGKIDRIKLNKIVKE